MFHVYRHEYETLRQMFHVYRHEYETFVSALLRTSIVSNSCFTLVRTNDIVVFHFPLSHILRIAGRSPVTWNVWELKTMQCTFYCLFLWHQNCLFVELIEGTKSIFILST